MFEGLITVLLLGFIAGFIFSIPIAGPISIVIVSNALKGEKRFCDRANIGATIIDFLYVFLAVYGLSKLFDFLDDFISYILIVGSIIIFIVGYQIFKTNIKFDSLNSKEETNINKGGFRTGFFLNLTNPTLLFGWLASSLVIFSLASTLGLNTGGLEVLLEENNKLMSNEVQNFKDAILKEQVKKSTMFLSFIYAFGVASGCYIWFSILTRILIKYRHKLKLIKINILTKGLALVLFFIGFYLIYQAIFIFKI